MKTNVLKINNGIFLDNKKLERVREYSIVQSEEDDIAVLTLKMDVTILDNAHVDDCIDKSCRWTGYDAEREGEWERCLGPKE